MLLAVLIVTVLFLYAVHVYIQGGRRGRLLAKIPGPSGWPIIGNLLDVLVPLEELWHVGRRIDKDNYPFYKFWLFSTPIVTILEPDNAEIILTSTQHITKSSVYQFLHSWFGTGLLTSTGAKWQKRRKILTPAFHFNVLQKYVSIIVENGEKTVQSLKAEGESVQSLLPFITNHTLNIICETAMGTTLQGRDGGQKDYRQAIHDMGNVILYRILRPWLNKAWIFNLTSVGRKQNSALKILHKFSSDIVKERIDYHEKTKGHFLKQLSSTNSNEEQDDEEFYGYRKKRLAMLDLLIAAYRDGRQIDDHGIREEVDTFMFEGHDTSAMGLCFCLLLIAEHKEVQERIREEVNEVLKESDGKIGISEIQKLNYLERCIKESLRLYPSVPFISRNLEEDLQLKGYLVPKGTIVDVHIYEIHRDPNYWPDPLKFDPDRFLPERIQGRHPFSYIPFSAGPRNCIGQKFAMMELKALVAQLVQNFYLEPVDLAHEVPILPDLVLRPLRPIHVKFVPITK